MSVSLAICALLAAIPSAKEMRGPFPIMSTPYFADGAVDYGALAREAKWTADCGCPGVIWCQSNDAVDLLTTEEKFKGFEACAKAVEGLQIVLTLGANGTNTAHMLEIAAKPAVKTVFAGWGGWQWLLQLRHCGSEGLVTERCAYAPILGEIWRRFEKGERGLALTEAFAMYRLLIDQRNMPGGLRGYSLYLLNKEGVFTNMVSRQYEKAKVTEGGSFGAGRKWKLETVKLNDIQKRELDILYADMMEFCRQGR